MAGGWGFPIGDEASGAWLGAQLVNAYLWHLDTHPVTSDVPPVLLALEKRIGREVSDVQIWSTNTCSTELASLAPIIVKAATDGDALAQSLLIQGAQCCDRLLSLAPDTLPLYIVGGLSENYVERINSRFRQRCAPPQGDALSGLFALVNSSPRGAV